MTTGDIRYIFLDFDGTIMCYEEPPGHFHPLAIDLINRLADQGITWCTNSGRNRADQLEVIERSRVKGLAHMPEALVCCESLVYCRRNGGYDGLQPWNDNARDLMTQFHTRLQRLVRPVLGEWESVFCPDTVILDERSTVFCVRDEDGLPARLHNELEMIVNNVPGGMVTRNGGWVVAMPDALGKGRALEAFLSARGADRRNALAIGDHLNDLDMLDGRAAMHVGCPADAMMEVKEMVRNAGGYVARADGPAGTVEVITHYLNDTK